MSKADNLDDSDKTERNNYLHKQDKNLRQVTDNIHRRKNQNNDKAHQDSDHCQHTRHLEHLPEIGGKAKTFHKSIRRSVVNCNRTGGHLRSGLVFLEDPAR